MTIARNEMVDRVRSQLGDIIGKIDGENVDWPDTAVHTRLDQEYRYTLTGLVPGRLHEGFFVFRTTAAQETYPYHFNEYNPKTLPVAKGEEADGETVHSLHYRAQVDDWWISVFTRPIDFWEYWTISDVSPARPRAILDYGGGLTRTDEVFNEALGGGLQWEGAVVLRPVPDQEYTIRVPSRNYPHKLRAAGVENDTVGKWLIAQTAYEIADELGEDGIAARAMRKAQPLLDQLLTATHARNRQLRKRRSF
jgi:hypothetical protein